VAGGELRRPPSPRRPPYLRRHPAEKACGAEIVLTTPTRRAIFIAGLVGAIVFGVLLVLIGLTR
jgi:hypothetical protein